jgi:DNA-binding response OmpR family regulator
VVSWQQAENVVLSLLECGVDQYFTFPICMGRLRNKVREELKQHYE